MLIVKNLDKSFDGNVIFKNLHFSVQDGEKVAVVGLNGAGKSTLFRILLNQIDCDNGEFYMGKNTMERQNFIKQNLRSDLIMEEIIETANN